MGDFCSTESHQADPALIERLAIPQKKRFHKNLIELDPDYQNEFTEDIYEQTVQDFAAGKITNFIDKDFPHSKASLFTHPDKSAFKMSEAKQNKYKNVKWMRIKDISKMWSDAGDTLYEPVLFSQAFMKDYRTVSNPDQIVPSICEDDLPMQGQIGNCYFLAALNSMAERPARIWNLFKIDETMLKKDADGRIIEDASPVVNDAGIILVHLYFNGVKTSVIVDDYLPVRPDKQGKLLFASTRAKTFWVAILEKAWAKRHGRYIRMEAKPPNYAFTHLTGAPTRGFWLKDVESLMDHPWEMMMEADQKDSCFIASSVSNLHKKWQIKGGHAYCVVGVYEFEYQRKDCQDDKRHMLIQLRNPWGNFEWQGRWSDFDEIWQDKDFDTFRKDENSKIHGRTSKFIREYQVDEAKKDDGTFFMNVQDFLKHFEFLSICSNNEANEQFSAYVTHEFDEFPNNSSVPAFFRFELQSDVKAPDMTFALQASQQGKRCEFWGVPDKKKAFVPARFSYLLFKIKEESPSIKESSCILVKAFKTKKSIHECAFLDGISLERGSYICMVDGQWPAETSNDVSYRRINFSVHSREKELNLRKVPTDDGVRLMQQCFNSESHAAYEQINLEAMQSQGTVILGKEYGNSLRQQIYCCVFNETYGYVRLGNETDEEQKVDYSPPQTTAFASTCPLLESLKPFKSREYFVREETGVVDPRCSWPVSLSILPGETKVILFKKLK